MTAVLSDLVDAGYQIALDGEEIVCSWQGPGEPDIAQVRPLIEKLRHHKAEAVIFLMHERVEADQALPHDLNQWSSEWIGVYKQRAAIMQLDGKLARIEAEYRAEELVRESYRQRIGR
jgi:hypothetical protein